MIGKKNLSLRVASKINCLLTTYRNFNLFLVFPTLMKRED